MRRALLLASAFALAFPALADDSPIQHARFDNAATAVASTPAAPRVGQPITPQMWTAGAFIGLSAVVFLNLINEPMTAGCNAMAGGCLGGPTPPPGHPGAIFH